MQELRPEILGKRLYARVLNEDFAVAGRPWLIFLHEGLGSTEQWRDYPQKLADAVSLPALAYDRWGYGKSELKAGINKPDYMHYEAHEMLPSLLDHLGIRENVIPVGHSDGGTIALLFAAAFPGRTCAVISECDHVVGEEVTLQGVRTVAEAYNKDQKLKKMLAAYHGDKTDDLFRGWTGLWLSDEAKEWSIVDTLGSIVAPLLAIQGTDDQYGSVEQLILKLRHCSGPVQINLLKGCGHIPHHEFRDEVFELMKQFILKTSGSESHPE